MNAHRVAKTAAMSVHAMTNLHKPKHLRACLLPKHLRLTATQAPTTTVNDANAVHATVMAAIAANAVATAFAAIAAITVA